MNTNRTQRRGISFMLVTAVVAVASVLGLAILSSSTLQSEAAGNQDLGVHADGFAESAVSIGIYYLENLSDSSKCPMPTLANPGGTYTKTAQSLGSGVPGTYDLTIKRLSDTRYSVTGTGYATASWGTVSRTLSADVDVNYFPFALNATNASTLFTSTLPAVTSSGGTTILGDVYSNGPLKVNATVTGNIFAGGLLSGLLKTITGVLATLIPSPANVNHYASYSYKGVRYTAQSITLVTDIPATPNVTTNPAGVYVCAGSLDLTGNNNIKGTIVTSGALRISGTGNSITPTAGFPAVVVDSDISFKASGSSVDILGLAFIGGKVTRSGAYVGCKLNILGGLLYGGSSTISLDANIALQIKHDRAKASIPSLITSGIPQPTSVTIVSWKN
jgi:cytoskeletal protein CcmA (bactofilin family)